MNHDRPETGQEINLASILNILWRRRILVLSPPALGLVVGLLYSALAPRQWEATVTIRPGITAFSPDGTPQRQWRLKDITRWYEKRLYERELARCLGLPSGERIDIRTEYIAPGLHDYVGGDVITLWTIARSPELAVAVLDSSLALFNSFSEADTVGSQLKLTDDDLRLQIRRQEVQLDVLSGEGLRLDLQIESARIESTLIMADDERLRLGLDQLEREAAFLKQRLISLGEQETNLADDLKRLDLVLHRLGASNDEDRVARAEIPSWVRRDAILDSSSVLESLTRARLLVLQTLARNRALQDSLSLAADVKLLDRAVIMVQREINIPARLKEVRHKIGEMTVAREVELPSRREVVLTNIDANRTKLGTISPLQRVGTTVVSEMPVRPRPLRATAILVLSGGFAGIVLGLVWEYLYSQRRVIFRS